METRPARLCQSPQLEPWSVGPQRSCYEGGRTKRSLQREAVAYKWSHGSYGLVRVGPYIIAKQQRTENIPRARNFSVRTPRRLHSCWQAGARPTLVIVTSGQHHHLRLFPETKQQHIFETLL